MDKIIALLGRAEDRAVLESGPVGCELVGTQEELITRLEKTGARWCVVDIGVTELDVWEVLLWAKRWERRAESGKFWAV